MEDEEIRERIYNIELVVEDINVAPQTYHTILKQLKYNGTCNIILRRKLSILFKEGKIYKTTIPATRYGMVLFYCKDKKYNILVEADRSQGSKLYYFYNYEVPRDKKGKLSKFYVKVKEPYELIDGNWEKIDEKVFFNGNALLWL